MDKFKIYMTIDKEGIDGFGFDEDAKNFRRIRAEANRWRGMRYIEGEINRQQMQVLVQAFRKKEHDKVIQMLKILGIDI